jgi:hypothetical protein
MSKIVQGPLWVEETYYFEDSDDADAHLAKKRRPPRGGHNRPSKQRWKAKNKKSAFSYYLLGMFLCV